MFNFKIIFQIAILFILGSCANNLQRLANLENKLKIENFYSSYLALEYLEYSRSLLSSGDWYSSQYFAKKGLDSAKGYEVVPEDPIRWGANQVELEDLISAQKRYEKISTFELKKALPIQMAHLAFLYDCWVSKESKPAFRTGELARCKDRFYKLLDEVEYYKINSNKETVQQQTIIVEMEFTRYLIAFDFNKFNLTEGANKKLIEVLNAIDDMDGDYRIVLVGNADRTGKNLYNETLALKRLKIVESYLTKNGVPLDIIDSRVSGEDFPDIITKDHKQQQFNRTVGVYIIKGAKSVEALPLPVIKNEAYKQEIEKAKQKKGLR